MPGLLRLTLSLILLTAFGCTSGAVAEQPQTVLVAGAAGQTGRLVVEELLAEGYAVRALVRDEAAARTVLGDRVEYVVADVRQPQSLATSMNGADAVISAIGAGTAKGDNRPEMVDYLGVKNLAEVAASASVGQFVLISSRSVTDENHPLNRMFGDVLKWKLRGENALRASGVPYTIIRPGGLINEPGGQHAFVLEQGDSVTAQTTIARADLAKICVEALAYPEARFKTFETNTIAGSPAMDWAAAFGSLEPDPR